MLQYADGYAYSKSKFDDGLRIVLADKPAKPAKAHSNVKKEDVDLIVRYHVSRVSVRPLISLYKGLGTGNTPRSS
jgi:hypothetical protein